MKSLYPMELRVVQGTAQVADNTIWGGMRGWKWICTVVLLEVNIPTSIPNNQVNSLPIFPRNQVSKNGSQRIALWTTHLAKAPVDRVSLSPHSDLKWNVTSLLSEKFLSRAEFFWPMTTVIYKQGIMNTCTSRVLCKKKNIL